MRYICARVLLALIPLAIAFHSIASAQTRNFVCPNNRAITVTVINKRTITASPIDGTAMTMRQTGGNPFYFAKGDYSLTISPDQTKATVDIPDFGVTVCRFRPGAAASRKGLGHEDPCGPGFHQIPETDACAPNGVTPPPARPRPMHAQGRFPLPGRSLGGIVRRQPSMQAPKVTSLQEGEPIVLLSRADAMDGYDWFRIRYHGGRTGYQWGGIMCAQAPIRGVLERCKQ
jgi:hypothetical protein